MGQPKRFQFKRLNGYSWSIIVSFIFAAFSMQYHTAAISFDAFFQTLPLIVMAVYWCEKYVQHIKLSESNLTKKEQFNRDLFILSFSFLLACLISLVFAYNNSDAKGWWSFIIYFITLYGVIFAFIFSIIALLIKNHKIYTIIFSFLIIVLVAFGDFFPHYMLLPLLGSVDTFFIITGSLLIVHCLFAIGCRVVKLFCNGSASRNLQQ